eukprot:1069783-Amphidinium_carterae.1
MELACALAFDMCKQKWPVTIPGPTFWHLIWTGSGCTRLPQCVSRVGVAQHVYTWYSAHRGRVTPPLKIGVELKAGSRSCGTLAPKEHRLYDSPARCARSTHLSGEPTVTYGWNGRSGQSSANHCLAC